MWLLLKEGLFDSSFCNAGCPVCFLLQTSACHALDSMWLLLNSYLLSFVSHPQLMATFALCLLRTHSEHCDRWLPVHLWLIVRALWLHGEIWASSAGGENEFFAFSTLLPFLFYVFIFYNSFFCNTESCEWWKGNQIMHNKRWMVPPDIRTVLEAIHTMAKLCEYNYSPAFNH